MILTECTMRDIYEGLYDGPHATPPVSEEGAIFLGISNITPDGHIDLSDIKYIGEEYLPKWTKRVTPRGGDIVFSYEATLNLYAIIPEDFWGCLGRRMALIRPDESKAHGKYLYYYFFSPEWRATIAANTITGATVDRIPIAKFPDFPVRLPEISVQRRIAEILSKYDDLIENNKKQIKLLEEAAQRLYKEWFVDLRFPGCDECNIVDNMPEGWNCTTLQDISLFVRGKTITKKDVVDGTVPVVAGGLEPAYYHNKSLTEVPVITVSGSGANAGFTRMYFQKIWASDCSYVDGQKTNYIYFTYCLLKDRKQDLDNMQKGAAQPHVYAKDINALKLIRPTDELLSKFETIVRPYFEKIAACHRTIGVTAQARDRLLLKLMNGDIEV